MSKVRGRERAVAPPSLKSAKAVAQRQAAANGIKNSAKNQPNESRAVVVDGRNVSKAAEEEVVEISSGEDSSTDYSSSSDEENESPDNNQKPKQKPSAPFKEADEDVEMADDAPKEDAGDDEEISAEPSFGELVQAQPPEPIIVEDAFADGSGQSNTIAPLTGSRALQPPSAVSLGTVLTQSLKTNDLALLESCLHTTDVSTIRTTIERLDSALATELLQKLAERLHRRPGRASGLMIWVQWTLVAHGGYLANQPDLMRRLGSLHRVIKERASGLQPLLSLKGKLDMLEAQMQLRKKIQESAASRGYGQDEEDDEAVIYVEGEDEDSEEEEDHEMISEVDDSRTTQRISRTKKDPLSDAEDEEDDEGEEVDEDEDEDEDDDEIPRMNGAGAQSDEDESEEEDLIDDEAEESDNDSEEVEEDEVDHDDVESSDDEDESDHELPSAKKPAGPRPAKTLFSKRR